MKFIAIPNINLSLLSAFKLLMNIDINNINNNNFAVVQLFVSFFSAFTETPLIGVREIIKKKRTNNSPLL